MEVSPTTDIKDTFGDSVCKVGQYCLGYGSLFSPISPSLTRMLLALAATNRNDTDDPINTFVDCLESRETCRVAAPKSSKLRPDLLVVTKHYKKSYAFATFEEARKVSCHLIGEKDVAGRILLPATDGGYPVSEKLCKNEEPKRHYAGLRADCEQDDANWQSIYPDAGPSFSCFRNQLQESVGLPRNRALLRAAIADFLFNYKMSWQYPQEFDPWFHTTTAQTLDNLFNPLVVEFNRDLTVYLRSLQDRITRVKHGTKQIEYLSNGIISVNVTSGSPAQVDTTTQSNVSLPAYFSSQAFLNALNGNKSGSGSSDSSSSSDQSAKSSESAATGGSDKSGKSKSSAGGKASATPNLLTGNLTPITAQAAIAFMQADAAKSVSIGRDLSLGVTANTLNGASAADLVVTFNSGDHDKPTIWDSGGRSDEDRVDHVSVHNVSTHVRVDSLKLFEVSSFSATLSHGREVPLIPPFVDLPYLGNLATLKLKPGTVYHRSFAILGAVIVPTAADIANVLAFHEDAEPVPVQLVRWNDPQDVTTSQSSKQKTNGAKPTSGTGGSVSVETSGQTAPVTVQIGSCTQCPTKGADKSQTVNSNERTSEQASAEQIFWVESLAGDQSVFSGPFRYRPSTQNGSPKPSQSAAQAAAHSTGTHANKPTVPNVADPKTSLSLSWEDPTRHGWNLYVENREHELCRIAMNLSSPNFMFDSREWRSDPASYNSSVNDCKPATFGKNSHSCHRNLQSGELVTGQNNDPCVVAAKGESFRHRAAVGGITHLHEKALRCIQIEADPTLEDEKMDCDWLLRLQPPAAQGWPIVSLSPKPSLQKATNTE